MGEVLVDVVQVRTVGPESCTAVEHEGGEVLEGEGLQGGVVLDRVVLVEPVRLLQQEQDPLADSIIGLEALAML